MYRGGLQRGGDGGAAAAAVVGAPHARHLHDQPRPAARARGPPALVARLPRLRHLLPRQGEARTSARQGFTAVASASPETTHTVPALAIVAEDAAAPQPNSVVAQAG